MGDGMADSSLSKLLSVDSDLVAQEAELVVQLEAIQAKRVSLQTVLKMFDADQAVSPDFKSANESTTAISGVVAVPPTATPTQTAQHRKGAKDKTTQLPKEVSSTHQKAKDVGQAAQSVKASSSPKTTRRGWREYVRDEYRQTPLSAVVSKILQGHPQKVFEIADVVDTIFVKEIPSVARTRARERVSNILAEGARKEHWYRGESGCYSFSKK